MDEYNLPLGGTDYPRTLSEFDEWFSCESDCLDFIRKLRWPNGFVCPSCKGTKGWQLSTELIRCTQCKRKVSILAGTTFHGTRKPLKTWLQAMWYVTSQKFGGSALGLKRVLGLGGYQTAWCWLHKLRHAMVRPGRESLCGTVEIDETLIGGEDHGGKRGRGAGRKSVVVIAVEILEPKGFGRIRMKHIRNASADNLIPFIADSVKSGSTIHTDCWRGYNQLDTIGYKHEKINISESDDFAHVLMPGVHRVASLLKRWLLGTHQGAVSAQHLDYYLDEYTFRFNRRKSTARGLLFYRLMQQAVAVPTITYRGIVD